MDKKVFENDIIKNLSYVGYIAGLIGGNFAAPTAGMATKLAQDTGTSGSKTIDYVRAGAFVYVTLDCLLGSRMFSDNPDSFETAMDLVTMTSLVMDMANYSFSKDPMKETHDDVKTYISKYPVKEKYNKAKDTIKKLFK
ncbi:MAG: hypothetical protein ACP5N1_04980 [Candidatus Woesearchaeota archaeon]